MSGNYTVTVDLGLALAHLVKPENLRKPRVTVELAGAASVASLLQLLGIPLDHIGFATVNGERVSLDRILRQGDFVLLVPPPLGGG